MRTTGKKSDLLAALHTRGAARFDRLCSHGTRLAGVGLLGTGVWSLYEQPSAQLIWGGVMLLSGIGLVALYLPILRIVAFACLLVAGLVILGGLSPFAAMDMSAAARERPGMEARQVAVMLGASASLVLLAFCIERARRLKLSKRAVPRASRTKALTGAAQAPSPPSPRADGS